MMDLISGQTGSFISIRDKFKHELLIINVPSLSDQVIFPEHR